jgi:PAS domain S-box-containing protein
MGLSLEFMLSPTQPASFVPAYSVDFQLAFEGLPGNLLLLAPDAPQYTILAISNELLRLTAGDRAHIVGRSIFEVYPENPAATAASGPASLRVSLQQALELKQPDQMPVVRYDLPTADGGFEARYWLPLNKPVLGPTGEVQYLIHSTEDVTARVQGENRQRDRRQLEQTYGLLLQAPVAVGLVAGPENVVELANAELLRLLGATADLVGAPLSDTLPAGGAQAVSVLLDQVRKSGRPYHSTEHPLSVPADGRPEQRYYNLVFQPYFEHSSDKTAKGVFVVAHNVTEQVLTRQRVEESEQKVNAFIESAPFPIGIYVGADMRIQFANQAILQSWGKGADVIGKRFPDVLPELESQSVFEQLRRVYATGVPFHTRNQRLELVVNQQRQTVYYNYSFTPLYDADGRVYGIMNTAAEVTDLVVARQRVEQVAAELQESEQRFRIMADATPNMVWAVNPDSSIRYINQAFLDFVGVGQEQYLASGWNQYMHPDELEGAQATLTQAISTRSRYALEHRMLRHDGQYRWLLAQGAPSYYSNGELYGYVGSAIDITELKQANEQLRRTNQDLDNFVYAASHDLKQPVNNLVGLFDEVQRAVTFTDPHEEQLLVPLVQSTLRHLSATIDDLAALGQAHQLRDVPAEAVDLEELTEEVINALEAQVRAARARITIDFSARPTITFPRANLRIVLLNLLSNSLKYADPARPARIHLSVWLEAGLPVLVVQDNGLGFDAQKYGAELFHLFRRFHTHTAGTGVGLYLVNRIVQANGGRIEVDSQEGAGATFRVWLGRV